MASRNLTYENANDMLLVDQVNNKEILTRLLNTMYDELPTPKLKKKK